MTQYISQKWHVLPSKRHYAFLFALTVTLLLTATLFTLATVQSQSAPPQWYRVDPHIHSVVSSDALIDIGIMSQAEQLGYDALFVSDHNDASSFHVNFLTANHMVFDDSYTRWEIGTYGDPLTTINELVSSPVYTGTDALHLTTSATGVSESYIWTKRGPNRRSGDIIIKVAIRPTQIDANSGAYVSASFGGDPTVVRDPYGYTIEQSGVISPGKNITLVWQLGDARVSSTDPNQMVLTYPLSYTLDAWNVYTINVSDAIDDIPTADLPLDYNGLVHLKLAVAANNGTADAYFDGYSINALSPEDPADEYVNRTSVIDDFNTADFKIYPAYEMGQQRHSNRFNYGITDAADHRSYQFGSDGIAEAHQLGYPSQFNHPDVTVVSTDTIANLAYGADFLEVSEDEWMAIWDELLNQGEPFIGTWSSDDHNGLSTGKPAAQVYATGIDVPSLMRAMFEGRLYNARNHFDGQLIFNLDSNDDTAPYPARYPVYHSDALTETDVHLLVTDDLGTNYTISWIRNDQVLTTITATEDDYEETRRISLTSPHTYVRSEVRNANDSLRAMSQPIFFFPVTNLPSDKSFHIERVTTDNGLGYHKQAVQGITATSWSTTSQVLYAKLENPADALVELHMTTDSAPQDVEVDNTSISASASLANFQAATTSAWFYDSSNTLLYLKVLHATTRADLLVEFSASGDTTPPTTPANLTAEAPTLGQVALTWSASTDDLAVRGYQLYRNNNLLATLDETLSYTDTSVSMGTTYTYTISAFDVAGNASALSSPVTVTATTTGTFTFTPVADAYVASNTPDTNYGSSSALRVDASPVRRGYLRFDVQDLAGLLSKATLYIYANNSSSDGVNVASVSDNTWEESTITYNNAPALGTVVDSTTAYSADTLLALDVTSLIQGEGLVSFGLETDDTFNLSFSSREGNNIPQLIIETNDTGTPTPTPTPTATNTPAPPTATPTSTPIIASAPYTITVSADSYVSSNAPTTNYGQRVSIRVDGASPIQNSYLRFDLSNFTGSVSQATLRIFANSGSSTGYDAHSVSDNSWGETTITYNNAPTIGNTINSSSNFSSGSWTEIDVTSAITLGDELTFALTGSSSTGINLASGQSSNVPELIIEGPGTLFQIPNPQPLPTRLPPLETLHLPIIIQH